MTTTDARIDLVYTFPGNPRSEQIIYELNRLGQQSEKLEDRTAFKVLSQETPLFREVATGRLGAVALIDRDLSSGKHTTFVAGRSHDALHLPGWASTAKYVVKVGQSCHNVGRSAQQIFAIFVSKFAARMEKYPLPWGPAKDPQAKKAREEKRKLRNKNRRHFRRSYLSPSTQP